MNKLINIVLSGLLWRRYKFLLISLIVLIVAILLVGQIHQDYVSYAQNTESVSLGWSFAIKWLVWISSFVIFIGLNHWHNQRKQRQADLKDNNSNLKRIINWKRTHPPKVEKRDKSQDSSSDNADPFAHLREKEKLRSYAELIIEKKPSDEKKSDK